MEADVKTLHVGYPNVGDELLYLCLMDEVIETRRLTNDGPVVKLFEDRLAEFLDVEHVVAVANATLGLEILVRALDMDKDVIVPSFTFIATPNAVTWCGGRPVFADVAPDELTIDPRHVERLVTKRTSGIVGVHTFGHPCKVDELQVLADSYNVPLIFDAAHALGCSYKDQKIGHFGRAEVFSFHATKVVNSIEGGAIATSDPDLAATCRQMRNFGIERGEVVNLGINAKMSEVHAAMGLVNLAHYDEIVEHNEEMWGIYEKGLADVDEAWLIQPHDGHRHNYHYVPVYVREYRDTLWEYMRARDILVRRYFHPGCHRLMPYVASDPDVVLPKTEWLTEHILCLPTGQGVDESDVHRVCDAIKEAL
jgi:dTDP-4-amino-4,6-dideoxygalactose transaminase